MLQGKTGNDVLPAATIVTTMEVEVEELCKMAVTMTPIIMPHTGLRSSALSRNALPAKRPVAKKHTSHELYMLLRKNTYQCIFF